MTAGFLVYMKSSKGIPIAQRWTKEFYETRRKEGEILAQFEVGEDLFALSLSTLKTMFPCPERKFTTEEKQIITAAATKITEAARG